jgi:hypothetical protein
MCLKYVNDVVPFILMLLSIFKFCMSLLVFTYSVLRILVSDIYIRLSWV